MLTSFCGHSKTRFPVENSFLASHTMKCSSQYDFKIVIYDRRACTRLADNLFATPPFQPQRYQSINFLPKISEQKLRSYREIRQIYYHGAL